MNTAEANGFRASTFDGQRDRLCGFIWGPKTVRSFAVSRVINLEATPDSR